MSQLSLNNQLNEISREWRENSRLRYGVYVVLGIFWVYALLVLRDQVKIEAEAWQAAQSRNERARAAATSADWLSRQQDASAAVAEFESLLWREGSIGLSQAAFQERIAQSFSAASITVRSLRVAAASDAPVSPELGDIVPLRARVQIEFRPATFYPWLAELAKSRVVEFAKPANPNVAGGLAANESVKRQPLGLESMTIRATTVANTGQLSTADLEIVGYALKSSGLALPVLTAPTPAPSSSASPAAPIR